MLTTEAIEEALSLTQSFDEKGIVLQPIEGTPLAELVKQTLVIQDAGGVDITGSAAATNAIDKQANGSSHDMVMDEAVASIAKSVQAHISYAKNVVSPTVAEYIGLVEADIVNLPNSGLAKYCITNYELPAPMQSDAFLQSLAIFRETPYEEFRFDLNLPDLDETQLVDLVKTGSVPIDELVEQWVAKVGIEFLYSVYRNIFQIKPYQDPNYSREVQSLRQYFQDKAHGNDYALAIYLLANKLNDNPPEDTEHTLDDYNTKILTLRNQAGNRLSVLAAEIENAYANRKLIKEYKPGTKEVVVYPNVYSHWLESGGDNDVILGSIVSENNYYTVDAIEEDAAKLKSGWDAQKRIEERTALNNKFVYVKESLKSNFLAILGKENFEGKEESTIKNIFNEELALLRIEEIADICQVCLKLLCRSLYFKTDALRILSSIDKIGRENPSIDVRESALLATIELLTDWACAQLMPVNAYGE